jgi:hypothetical protein
MTSSELSPSPTDRRPLDASVVRVGVLAMLALIVGSMRPRPSASSAAPALAANPAGQLPSNSASAPRKTRG